MNRTEAADWDQMARHLAGELSADEAAALRAWLEQDPHHAELLAALEQTLTPSLVAPPASVDTEAALRRVKDHAASSGVVELRPRTGRRLEMLRTAAAIVLIATGGLWLRQLLPGRQSSRVSPIPGRTIEAAIGHWDNIRLSDGTRVVLGPGSRLDIPAGYGMERREVTLTGVGYFDVRHDSAHPFTVRAGSVTIRDVGTSFGVRNAPGLPVQVVVRSGSVAVQSAQSVEDTAMLRAGDRGEVDTSGTVRAERGAATDEDLAWVQGRLVFRDAPMDRVVADVRRWYGIVLRPADSSIAHRHLTASFANDPVDQVLKVIGLSLGATIERQGDTAVVRPGSPHGSRRS